MGYAPKSVTLATVEWKNGVAEDPGWGTAARPATLTDRLPEKVSDAEKKAYDQYRQAYERFWRQFFDPISIRVDSKPEQVTETTVFILPLINSSIYDQIRDFFPARPHAKPGSRPTVTPSPIGMMSLTLSEEKWIDFLEVASNMIERRMGIHLPIWEQLGPGIHVGVADSDSVITLGSGELLEIFGGRSNMRGNEMLLVPLIGSIFTRPVVIAMDLKDANATREALQGIPTGTLMDDRGFLGMKLNLVEITGRDRWLIRLEMEDLLFITLSMEVQDDFLVFSNLPLTYQPRVTGSEPLPMRDAHVRLNPGALDKTGPGFAASALDAARKQAMAGLGILKKV